MLDLVTTTEETHYELYRQAQMETRKFGEPKVKKLDNPKFKEEEESLRKRFTEQVKMEEARFRQWEQHVSQTRGILLIQVQRDKADSGGNVALQLIAERDRLNKDLENAHSAIKSLEVSLGFLGPISIES
jgi:cell division control protein 12